MGLFIFIVQQQGNNSKAMLCLPSQPSIAAAIVLQCLGAIWSYFICCFIWLEMLEILCNMEKIDTFSMNKVVALRLISFSISAIFPHIALE